MHPEILGIVARRFNAPESYVFGKNTKKGLTSSGSAYIMT